MPQSLGKLQGTLQHLQLGEEPLSTGDVLDLKTLHAELAVMKQEKVTLNQTVNQLTAEMDVPGSVAALQANAP